jgi:hypothetical protein
MQKVETKITGSIKTETPDNKESEVNE